MVSRAVGASFCWSEVTSVSSGSCAKRCVSRGAPVVELVKIHIL